MLLYGYCFLSFTLNLRAISKYKPPGAYIRRGDLHEGLFALRVSGPYIEGGLYIEGFIFGILRYVEIYTARSPQKCDLL